MQLDVKPGQRVPLSFPGNNQNVACFGPDGGLLPNIREVCSRDHVHDSPDGVTAVPDHVVSQCFADDAVSAVTRVRNVSI